MITTHFLSLSLSLTCEIWMPVDFPLEHLSLDKQVINCWDVGEMLEITTYNNACLCINAEFWICDYPIKGAG